MIDRTTPIGAEDVPQHLVDDVKATWAMHLAANGNEVSWDKAARLAIVELLRDADAQEHLERLTRAVAAHEDATDIFAAADRTEASNE